MVARYVSAAILTAALCVTAETFSVTLQTGLNGYAGVTNMELRDPVQGDIGASWADQVMRTEMQIQAN